eukprot:CAMPEP_0184495086 /NCGR_PEP_ID=MMETSP0113_2-20130426/30358_1 /TAXON_ID=91329 /ORGANISM="Norrisiella sphaerica, Strain BC52" /LENGTH=327 /DNA_ID=CAMNT_0026881125 /DNA_START=59 /DNA_END=1042 /DNA_ORIENTATION=-
MFVGTALLVTLACVTFSTQSRHVGLGQARSFAARTSRLTPSTFRPTRLGFDKFLSDSVASRSMLCRAINKMDEPAGTKHTLVLVRHGESDWNARNLFTGWADVELSEKGKKEGKTAGTRLKEGGFEFDLAYTSLLKRAIETLDLCIHEMGEHWIPVIKDWRLNERHYGALEGLNKAETAAKHGEDMVKIWRRSYDIPPPPIEEGDPRDKASLRQYKDLTKEQMPLSESLRNTVERVIPYWDEEITRSIKEGKNVLVAAHGNSLRALVKHLDGISDEEITGLNIPTGIPLVYYLDADLKPLGKFYLASDEELESAVSAVANQGKAVAK